MEEKQNENISVELLKNKRMYSIYETDLKEKNTVNLFDSKDCISGEFVFLYPPGIPLVVPGEVITEELLEQIKVYLEANMNISGLKDNSNKTIEVVKINWRNNVKDIFCVRKKLQRKRYYFPKFKRK